MLASARGRSAPETAKFIEPLLPPDTLSADQSQVPWQEPEPHRTNTCCAPDATATLFVVPLKLMLDTMTPLVGVPVAPSLV